MPGATSIPGVRTCSPATTFSVESMFCMISAPPSWPITSPRARLVSVWPVTVELRSLISVTLAKVGPTSLTLPTSAPPSAITTSPFAIPSSVPFEIVTDRRASLDSRAITSAAAVW